MEAVLAIARLRAPGYSQRALDPWRAEDRGWLDDRAHAHRVIRGQIVQLPGTLAPGRIRTPDRERPRGISPPAATVTA
jgi:hypothetical protein